MQWQWQLFYTAVSKCHWNKTWSQPQLIPCKEKISHSFILWSTCFTMQSRRKKQYHSLSRWNFNQCCHSSPSPPLSRWSAPSRSGNSVSSTTSPSNENRLGRHIVFCLRAGAAIQIFFLTNKFWLQNFYLSPNRLSSVRGPPWPSNFLMEVFVTKLRRFLLLGPYLRRAGGTWKHLWRWTNIII